MTERDLFDDFRDPDWDSDAAAAASARVPQGLPLVVPPGLPLVVFRGRGAALSPQNRFASWQRAADDDGWPADDPEAREAPRTELIPDHAKSAIARNESPDLPFAQSVNPYRGCEHGCAYCFARPSHAWLGYSPGIDFETRIVYKPDIAPLLRRELSRSSYRCTPLAIGTNTDAWQPAERQLGISRALLEVCLEAGQPVSIVTKSALLLRDADLLKEMARQGLAQVMISVTGLDPELSRRLEPRAASPKRRIEVIGELAQAGIPVGVMFAPAIPGLNDHAIEAVLAAAAEAGAGHAAYGVLRLPDELAPMFRAWLAVQAPERTKRVMAVLYDLRGGQADDPRFGHRMRGLGHFADLLEQRFRLACRRLGLDRQLPPLDCGKFRKPRAVEADRAQLGLF